MVTAAPRTHFFAFVVAAGLSLASASAKDLAEYKVGDQAEEDVVTPIALTVLDADATEALKQKEAQAVPLVISFNTNEAAQAVSAFRSRFRNTRNRFLTAVENAFGRRTLTPDQLASPQFEELARSFQQQNRQFPLDPHRAALWATGDPDRAYEESLSATISQFAARPIRADNEAALSGTVWIVPVGSRDEILTAAAAEARGQAAPRNELETLAAAKRNFQAFFPNEERAVARYLATLIKANCVPEREVTSAWRARRTEALSVTDTYAAGQIIVKRGQAIDPKAKAALDQLKEKMAFAQLQQLVVTDQMKTARELQAHRWVLGLAGSLLALLLVVIWRLTRRPQMSLMPAPFAIPDPHQPNPWQDRALAAEHKVQQTQAMMRSGVMSHLAHWLSDKLVQKLISHRTHLLETQQKTAAEMDNLEERLKDIHSRMHERLVVYERQIAELEKELKSKGEENRELIRAEIETIRRQMEIEREKSEIEVNLSKGRN